MGWKYSKPMACWLVLLQKFARVWASGGLCLGWCCWGGWGKDFVVANGGMVVGEFGDLAANDVDVGMVLQEIDLFGQAVGNINVVGVGDADDFMGAVFKTDVFGATCADILWQFDDAQTFAQALLPLVDDGV